MWHGIHPILVAAAVPLENGGIRFLHREDQIDIDADIAPRLWQVLAHCNGRNDIAKIVKLTKLQEDFVSAVISDLMMYELITDANSQYLHFHRVSSFPTPYYPSITQSEAQAFTTSSRKPCKPGIPMWFKKDTTSALHCLQSARRSCRNFSDEPLNLTIIGNICHYGYSIADHSVPSGGALYPLKIYILVEKDQNDILQGYYEYDAEQDTLVQFNKEVDIEQLKYCFNQNYLPFNSSVQIIIAADFERQAYKYGNRAYRLAILEAGHVASNIYFYCAENNIGTCELGGILDKPMMQELKLKEDSIFPLLGIAIGYKAPELPQFNELLFVETYLKAPNGPIESIEVTTFDKDGSFFGATALGSDSSKFAGATSTSSANAIFKASIEGYERFRSTQPRIDFFGSAQQLNAPYLHPKDIAPLTDEQATQSGLIPFSVNHPINWTIGKRYHDNMCVYVPTDIAYYHGYNDACRIYFSHSSGVAAYTNYEEAQKRALTELIERDALMYTWYTHKSPNIIHFDALPTHIQHRIMHWKNQNRRVYVLHLKSDYALVIHIIIIGNEYPYLTSGAAASIENDLANTVNKAMQEAEYSLLLGLQEANVKVPKPNEVHTPLDHGHFYQTIERLKSLEWLWSGTVTQSLIQHRYSVHELMTHLNIVTVDFSEDNFPIKVVRVFAPSLIPISFGLHLAHYTHPRLAGKVHPDSIQFPHYFS